MEQRIFGYARVSSQEQNLDRQLEQLEDYVPAEFIRFVPAVRLIQKRALL